MRRPESGTRLRSRRSFVVVAEGIDDVARRGASYAFVSALRDDGRLEVRVQDDGNGAHLQDGPPGRSWSAPSAVTSRSRQRRCERRSHARSRRRRRHAHARGDQWLLRDAGVDVVAEAEDADGLLRHVRLARPDAAIVDIRMPPDADTDEGLVAAQQIRAEHPDVGVPVLSHYVEPSYAMRLIEEHPSASATCSRSGSSTWRSSSTPSAASPTARP